MGRFVSADAFSRKLLVNPQDLNLYSYTINNPLRFTDPNGKDWKDIAKGIAQGANNFVEHTYAAAKAAAKDPFTVIHGAASAIETATAAYGTAKGRSALAAQWNSMSQQEKTAVVTESLIAGGLAGGLKAQGGTGTTADALQGAANRAAAEVGPGSGATYGTAVHSEFASQVEALGNPNLSTEQSYLNGNSVTYGTPGSIRADVVEGPVDNPTAVYDLKTGNATLTPERVTQIQNNLPGGTNVPVKEIKPQQ